MWDVAAMHVCIQCFGVDDTCCMYVYPALTRAGQVPPGRPVGNDPIACLVRGGRVGWEMITCNGRLQGQGARPSTCPGDRVGNGLPCRHCRYALGVFSSPQCSRCNDLWGALCCSLAPPGLEGHCWSRSPGLYPRQRGCNPLCGLPVKPVRREDAGWRVGPSSMCHGLVPLYWLQQLCCSIGVTWLRPG